MVLDYFFIDSKIQVCLSGELDMFSVKELDVFLEHLDALSWKEGSIDMNKVSYLDSSGLVKLIAFVREQRKKRGRKLKVVGMDEKNLSILSLLKFDKFAMGK